MNNAFFLYLTFRRPALRTVLTTLLTLLLLSGCRVYAAVFYGDAEFEPGLSNAQIAQKLRQEGKYEQAIARYLVHIQRRMHDPRRPDDENPYFYYAIIGDIYLQLDDVVRARESYETAHTQGVDAALVKDKFRGLARWHEQRGEYEEAINILKQYRDLDPLMIDSDIDRNHKEMVAAEQKLEENNRDEQPSSAAQ